ncbi:MAG: sugar transferase [Thermoleophilia bacterium]
MKRLLDIAAALALAPFALPLGLVIAVLIKLDSRGPVIFPARRVGLDGRMFTMYKFRTMVAAAGTADQPLTRLADERVTRIGARLRALRADELPQLFNVLKGDMSLVGPRPEDPAFVSHYSDEERRVLTVRPGITGPSQLCFRNESLLLDGDDYEQRYIEEIMPLKLSLDLEYVENHSLGGDLLLLTRTLALPWSRS